MAVTVTEDLVAASKITIETNGAKVVRLFLVSGTSGTRTAPYEALIADGVPRYGDAHPDIAGLSARKLSSEPAGKNFKTNQVVTVEYTTPEISPSSPTNATTIEIGGSNGLKTVSRWPDGDLKGELILVPFNPSGSSFKTPVDPKSLNTDPAQNGGNYYSYARLQVLSPNTVVSFTRRETVSPLTLSQNYRRRINGNTWNGGDKGTWLCRELNGTAVTGAGAAFARYWLTKYTFEYDPDGWTQYEFFRDARTGTVPPGVSVLKNGNNGWIKVNPYPYADFNNLRLPAVI